MSAILLVPGATDYIVSPTCVDLLQASHEVVIFVEVIKEFELACGRTVPYTLAPRAREM